MPSNIVLPDDPRYHEDLEAERADRRYELALKRLTVSDVISEVDALIRDEIDERKHPLYTLAKHVLRHGGFRSSGRRAYVADQLGTVYEDLIDEAIERLVQEELESGVSWED
jgi:hypothetical protein